MPTTKGAASKKSRAATSREKVRAHRSRLRAKGLRHVQIGVLDTRSRRFALAAHRQSQAVARSEHAEGDQAFIDAVSDVRSR